VFISKFLSPIKPPSEIYNREDNRAIERAARFVSLIPFIDDSQLFKDMPDLVCNSQEFLDLGQGDSEEHAMLLCNYFNYIDRDQKRQKINPEDKLAKGEKDYHSYIVYGETIPDGDCWYVARRDCVNNFIELWNPMTAECFNFDLVQTTNKGVFGDKQSSNMN